MHPDSSSDNRHAGMASNRGIVLGAIAAITLGVAHVIMSYGYAGIFWGDHGRWLHEVDRFANGEVLYRDFYWPFPPLAMWLLGGMARWLGSNVEVIWSLTGAVCLLICWCYYAYAKRLVDGSALPLTVTAGLLLAFAHANKSGVPLPLGAYSPAAPIGVLLLLLAMLVLLDERVYSDRPRIALLGLLAGACIATKHDFWLPALFIIGGYAWTARARLVPDWKRNAGIAVAACGAVVALSAAVVVATAGTAALAGVVTGFGHLQELGGRGLPSWERLVVEWVTLAGIGVATALATFLTSSSRRARVLVLIAAAHLLVGALIHGMNSNGGLENLWFDVQSRLFPALLPAVVLGIVWARRADLTPEWRPVLITLLAIAVAARARRGFQGVDWYHFLLSLPIYMLALRLLIPRPHAQRIAVTLLIGLAAIGGYEYREFGRGPLTHRTDWEWVSTAKGKVRMPAGQASDYRWLRSVLDRSDPKHERPVFALGYTGGFAYFLGRRNPAPITQGFRLSLWEPNVVARSIRNAAPFLIDNRAFHNMRVPSPDLNLERWDILMVPSHYSRFDRPRFTRLIRECGTLIGALPARPRPRFRLYNCGKVRSPAIRRGPLPWRVNPGVG